MTLTDVPLGMRLKSAAGWNQTEVDWQRVLKLEPTGSYVGQCDGVDVGTVATIAFGPVAWIGMMLVDPAARGQGVGKLLMQTAIDMLQQRGVTSIRLDATPQGQPLYEKLGFTADFALTRFAGQPAESTSEAIAEVAAITAADLEEIVRLDREVTKTDRRRLIEAQFHEQPALVDAIRHESKIVGFVLSRAGCNATQVGPCLALDRITGEMLVRHALAKLAGQPVFIDVPDENTPARNVVRELGLAAQRPLLRMTRGGRIAERPELIWGAFGPEKG